MRTQKGTPSSTHPERHTLEGAGRRARNPVTSGRAVLLLACLGLSACGGPRAVNERIRGRRRRVERLYGPLHRRLREPGATDPGPGPTRAFSAMRECLQKNGITLPKATPGARRPRGLGFLGAGGGALPKGVTRAQLQAAMKKCGGGGRFLRGGPAGLNNPVFKTALAKFAQCLRQNGVNVPAPNTSGRGPVFGTKGLHTSSPQFRSATTKCRGALMGAFRRPPSSR